jgi:hypothetical protein
MELTKYQEKWQRFSEVKLQYFLTISLLFLAISLLFLCVSCAIAFYPISSFLLNRGLAELQELGMQQEKGGFGLNRPDDEDSARLRDLIQV